jgi:hypothetical protein
LWDSFTHRQGWLVEHLPILQIPIGSLGNHTVRIHNLLWYVSSFAGVAWLCFAYERWWETAQGVARPDRVKLRNGILVATLVLPVEVMHHLVYDPIGFFLTAVFSMLLVIGVGLWIGMKRGHG